jgi:hypothetical protein
MKRLHPVLAALVLTVAASCTDSSADDAADTEAATSNADDDGADSTGGGPVDEDAELSRAAGYESFTQVNATPFPSQHGLASTVNVFVSDDARAAYETIDPANRMAFPPFAAGAMLVKEHLDAAGAKDGYLVMLKAPSGYDPEGSDWWWARVDGAGMPQETGKVGFCKDCHAQVADFGHVFGVALDNRM